MNFRKILNLLDHTKVCYRYGIKSDVCNIVNTNYNKLKICVRFAYALREQSVSKSFDILFQR